MMGFDFGMNRIGVAVGQTVTGTATEVTVLRANDGIPDWHEIEKLIGEWQPTTLVVGLPLNMDGTESEMSDRASKFARRLTGRFNIPHRMMDERLSTNEAREYSADTKTVDSLAAKLILESFFREHTTS